MFYISEWTIQKRIKGKYLEKKKFEILKTSIFEN